MSFVKSLKCYLCNTSRTLTEENFPEDLYDLISQYRIDQLLWVCNACKNKLDDKTSLFRMFNKQDDAVDTFNLNVKTKKLSISSSTTVYESFSNSSSRDSFSQDADGSGGDTQSPSSLNGSYECSKQTKTARKYIADVLNKIKITRAEESLNKKIINSVLDMLVTEMKKKEEFSSVFNNKFYYTGSAYNDLRITSATEYDIDVVLHIPSYINLVPDFFDETFAFGKIKWETSAKSFPNVSASVIKFLEKNSIGNYLSPHMVLSWFQRHLDLVLNDLSTSTYPPHVVSVTNSSSGPARTIIIKTTLGYSISIDLVPVFEFDYSLLRDTPIYSEIEKYMRDANKNKWYMVPKACQGEIGDVTLSNSKLSWRLDFPNAEKLILYGKECAKNVLKMLKIFRDNRKWKNLASYYLKMIVMLEIIEYPSSDYWKNGLVFERTLDALNKLGTYLKDKNLPHFLTHENLLFKLNPQECIGCSNHLKNIIRKIECEPETYIIKFFLQN